MTMTPLGTFLCQPTHLEKEFREDKPRTEQIMF